MKVVSKSSKATSLQENPAMRLYKLLDELGPGYEARPLNISNGAIKGYCVYACGHGFEVFWDTKGYRYQSRPGFKRLTVEGAINFIINLKPTRNGKTKKQKGRR